VQKERRPAAARRDRTRPYQQTHAPARGRADRRARHAHRRPGDGAPRSAAPQRADDPARHPRRQARDAPRGASDQCHGRKDRRRRAPREPGAGSFRCDPRSGRGGVAMTAVLLKAIRDLRRRRLPAIVIFGTTLLAVLTATMTLSLMSQARDPYQAAFDAQKGAHLQVTFDSRIDPATLAGTPGLIGAAAFGGPYPATDMHFRAGGHKYL